LNSSFIDLNELMGSTSIDTTGAAAAAAADTVPMTVIEVPKNIDFVLNSNIGKILYDKLTITDIAGGITVRDARVSMDNLKMSLLEGSMSMSGY
jgi:hypothetical protein